MHATALAVHDAGGRCVGVIPEMFLHRLDPLCDEVVATADIADRKQRMIDMGDVFIVLPGGVGTLDEWISTLCVMCIGDDDHRPIIVANVDGVFDGTIQQLGDMTRTPFARGKDLNRTLVARTAGELILALKEVAKS